LVAPNAGAAAGAAGDADLTVQAPVKYELAINLKTAKALCLDLPLQLQ
jgi:hypothetical protein